MNLVRALLSGEMPIPQPYDEFWECLDTGDFMLGQKPIMCVHDGLGIYFEPEDIVLRYEGDVKVAEFTINVMEQIGNAVNSKYGDVISIETDCGYLTDSIAYAEMVVKPLVEPDKDMYEFIAGIVNTVINALIEAGYLE